MTLTLCGAGALYLIGRHFVETLPAPRAEALNPVVLARTGAMILRNRRFRAFTLLSTASFGGLFCFLASSSFVFIGLFGFSAPAYGLVLLSLSACYIVGTMLCRRLLLRLGLAGAVRVAGALSLTAGCLLAGLALAAVHSPWAIMVPAWLYMLGHGIHQPCGQSNAVAPFPAAAGAAAALAGCVMMTVAFASGAWVGACMDGTAWPLIAGMAFWSLVAAVSAWVFVPRAGRLP